jgi:hypothetical protein
MILKKLVIRGYRPFYTQTELIVDEQVTVLTGANDVGKTAILRLIGMICGQVGAQEDDQNLERSYDASVPWNEDNEVACRATFVVPNQPGYIRTSAFEAGVEIDIDFALTRNAKAEVAYCF